MKKRILLLIASIITLLPYTTKRSRWVDRLTEAAERI